MASPETQVVTAQQLARITLFPLCPFVECSLIIHWLNQLSNLSYVGGALNPDVTLVYNMEVQVPPYYLIFLRIIHMHLGAETSVGRVDFYRCRVFWTLFCESSYSYHIMISICDTYPPNSVCVKEYVSQKKVTIIFK